MEKQTEITTKEISFIDDIDFRNILYDRLNEIDKVFTVNANYSTIFLSISTLEGIFKHLAEIFWEDIKILTSYPTFPKGKRKPFNKISIDEFYILLSEIKILPKIEELEKVYKLFKDYRNFIHPQAQKKKAWAIDLGQAQMALGLLNATLSCLSQNIFIGKDVYQKVAGRPDYDKDHVLHLNLDRTSVHSFVTTKSTVAERLSLSFDLELPANSIFNFVFNFKDDGNFKMLRLDNRRHPHKPNCLLRCTQRYFWIPIMWAKDTFPPSSKKIFPVDIEIDKSNKLFRFTVDGKEYQFVDDQGKTSDLFAEFTPGLKVGFFNENRPVKLHNIKSK
ncbi:MAG: hypothetical protein WBC22_14245 [Sedimentisphaerales bacterium]